MLKKKKKLIIKCGRLINKHIAMPDNKYKTKTMAKIQRVEAVTWGM